MRQNLAGDGKALPDLLYGKAEGEGEDDEKTDDAAADVAFAWFGATLVLPTPAAALPRLPAAAKAIQLPEGALPGAPAPLLAATPLATAPAPEAAAPDAAPIDFKLPEAPVPQAAAPEGKPLLAAAAPDAQPAPERPAGPIRIDLPPAHDQAARPQPTPLAAIQPRAEAAVPRADALQPLAAPLAAAAIAPSPRRAAPRETTISTLAATAAAEAPRPHAVPAMADAQQPALDLRGRDAMTSMIERIEALRDTPGARETSIRLSPDALGTVDVSIRRDGDRVHVHFSADTPAARTALAEAQPRLAEIAEARGLRLGETSVDGGAAGQGQRRHEAEPRPAFTAAPASAPRGEPATDSDDRVA